MEENILDITNYNETCTICFKEDLNDYNTYITDCSHIFCKTCLDDWFQRGNDNCPLCRNQVQSYLFDGINYRLIIIHNTNENENENTIININENNDLNNLITRLNIRINRYKKLLFFMWIILFFSYQFLIYKDNYNTEIYNKCIQNTTRLTNNLNSCLYTIHEGDDPGTYLSVISNSEIKECFIPYRYYLQCF